jgi:hypothetical protein
MTHAWNHPGGEPSHEELMAFADGELNPDRQEAVAGWLAGHPDAAAEVEEVRRLTRLYLNTPPPEPSPEAWAAAFARIDRVLQHRPAAPAWRVRRPTWTLAGLAAAAAFGSLLLSRPLWRNGLPPAGNTGIEVPDTPDGVPFPVALAHEIDVVSVGGHDADALVTEPRLLGRVEFATAADVRLVNAEPSAADGWVGRMEEGAVPMIVATPAPDGRQR